MDVSLIDSIGSPTERARRELDRADIAVVLGGDGTLHYAADALIESQIPVYALPLGTENLFAREFGMTRSIERLLEAIRDFRVTRVDVGCASGRRFLVVASAGPDASVIHRLARSRRGSIDHLSYARPIAHEMLAPSIGRFSVRIDGRQVLKDERGFVIVANSRRYALGIDPAPTASIDDGLLNVVFFPASTSLEVMRWMIGSRLRRRSASGGLMRKLGREIEIESTGRSPIAAQLDGEAPPDLAASAGLLTTPLEISIEPNALRVLLPSSS